MTARPCKYECGTMLEGFDEEKRRYLEQGSGTLHTVERCKEAKERKQKYVAANTGQTNLDGHLSIKWLTAGKEEIIEALYNNFSKTHKIRFSQSHTAAFPNGVHFSICVYYEGEQE